MSQGKITYIKMSYVEGANLISKAGRQYDITYTLSLSTEGSIR